MRQDAFEEQRAERWRHFDAMVADLERGSRADPTFPRLYRLVCQDLALARDRGFAPSLVDALNARALRGHQLLYGSLRRRPRVFEFFAHDFPAAVRREGRLFALVSLLFYGSGLAVFALDLADPTLVYHLLSPDQVEDYEWMYDPANRHYGTRDATGDFSAFAFYVSNNIGVAFRTFAWGVFGGVGSLFLILMNGLSIGLVSAHVTSQGFGETFFPFVIGHGSFELTAIVLAGVAGTKLGWALLAPGRQSRGTALRTAAGGTVPLLYGIVLMLLVAAVIEAFWSAGDTVPAPVKYGVGAGLWVVVGAWLGLGGRGRAH